MTQEIIERLHIGVLSINQINLGFFMITLKVKGDLIKAFKLDNIQLAVKDPVIHKEAKEILSQISSPFERRREDVRFYCTLWKNIRQDNRVTSIYCSITSSSSMERSHERKLSWISWY